MMKRIILILSLIAGHLWPSQAQVMMLFSSDSLFNITSPADLDSLFYWFAADQGVTDSLGGAIATDEGVGTWQDLSGNGYDVTQGTNGARPVWKATGGPGSKPCIQFDGSNDFLASAAHWWGSDDLTIFVVMKFANATRDATEFIANRTGAGDTRQWRIVGNNLANGAYAHEFLRSADGSFSNYYSGRFSAKSTAWRNICFVAPASTSEAAYIDGSSQTLTEAGIGTGTTVYNLSQKLSVGGGFGGSAPLQGSISEIIVSRALTTAERQAIETYLNRKYDLY